MKKGQIEETFAVIAAILVGVTAVVIVYTQITPRLESIPKARASLAAHEIAFYISALSSVDEGSVMRDFNETYDIEIGQYSKFERFKSTMDMGNYYVKATLYDDKGVELAASDEISFVGFLDVNCEKGKTDACMKLEKAEIIFLEKKSDKPVDIRAIGELLHPSSGPSLGTPPVISGTGCEELKKEDLISTIQYYSGKYNFEEPFIKANIAAESKFRHCKDENTILHSVDPDTSNPVAWGYMQLVPDTASAFGADYAKPQSNIMGGVKVLEKYRSDVNKIFKNDEFEFNDEIRNLTVAAYNAGITKILNLIEDNCKVNDEIVESGCWSKIKNKIPKQTAIHVNIVLCYNDVYSLDENKGCCSINCAPKERIICNGKEADYNKCEKYRDCPEYQGA
jgi:hypothetical protein